jgi:hypothetical protein
MEILGPGGELRRLSTSIEDRAGDTRFVIACEDPLYKDRFAHMGYQPVGDDRYATNWFPRSADVARYYQRFAASIDGMVRQSARLAPVPWEAALLDVLRRTEGTGLTWWLYGSGALAVRGLAVEPGDLDFHVDDAFLAGRIFDDVLVTPVMHMDGWVADYTGRAFSHAIIEWLSAPRAELDDASAPHEQGPFIASHLETVQCQGHRIQVPPLSAQLRVCERRGLADRATLIRAAMASA